VGDRGRDEAVRYRFPPLERRGVIAGWRGGQIASVAVGLSAGVVLLRSRPTLAGAVLAVVAVGASVAVSFWPIRGRTGEQWLPLVARRLAAWSTGGRRQVSTDRLAGHVVGVERASGRVTGVVGPGRSGGRSGARLATLEGVSVVAVPSGLQGADAPMGVVLDRSARTATAVVAVRGHSFALLGRGDQDAAIAAWARVLSSMAREGAAVHRVQWIESCLPDDGGAVRRHRAAHAVSGPESAAGRSYDELVDQSSPSSRRHRVLLALSVHTAHSARAVRAAGGGAVGLGAVLGQEVASLVRALGATDIVVDGVLGPGSLHRVLREPSCRVPDTDPDNAVGTSPGAEGGHRTGRPWPSAVETHWDALRTDATWHATYWIAEWPRVDVTPDFLGPLLFLPLRRTIALTLEPVSPARAARQVAQARTADIADGELRRRSGFLITARHRREQESVDERDVELADGHAQYRFSGYVTVTADSRPELQSACSLVEQAAGQSRIELRLLYGEQDVAFTCSLPLGRGLAVR
jgi:hypothetical protein